MRYRYLIILITLLTLSSLVSCKDKVELTFLINQNELETLLVKANYDLDSIAFKTNIPVELIPKLHTSQAKLTKKGLDEFNTIANDLLEDGFSEMESDDYSVFDTTFYKVDDTYKVSSQLEKLYALEIAQNDSLQMLVYTRAIEYFENKTDYIINEEFGFFSQFGHMWDAGMVKIHTKDREKFNAGWNEIINDAFNPNLLETELNLLISNYVKYSESIHKLIDKKKSVEETSKIPIIELSQLSNNSSVLSFVNGKLGNELLDVLTGVLLEFFVVMFIGFFIKILINKRLKETTGYTRARSNLISTFFSVFNKDETSIWGEIIHTISDTFGSSSEEQAKRDYNSKKTLWTFILGTIILIGSLIYFIPKDIEIEENFALELDNEYTEYLKNNNFKVKNILNNNTVEFYKSISK